jgi:hypothetical protein
MHIYRFIKSFLIFCYSFAGSWFVSKQDLQSASNNQVCNAIKMTPTTTKGTPSLQQLLSYQLFDQTGPLFPVFNQSFSTVASSKPGLLEVSNAEGAIVATRAVVDISSSSDGLYDYVVLTDGPRFSLVVLLTRTVPTAEQNDRFARFLAANGFFLNTRDVPRPENCRYAVPVNPDVVPPSPSRPSDAAAPSNRVAIIVGSVIGSVAFLAIAVRC